MLTRFKRLHVYVRFSIYGALLVVGLFILFRISLNIVEAQYVREAENRTLIFADFASQRYREYEELNESFERLIETQLIVMAEWLVTQLDTTIEDWHVFLETYNIDSIAIYDEAGLIYQATFEDLVGNQVTPGHPLYEFIFESDARIYVEPMRDAVGAQGRFKFVTIKTPEDHVLQVGRRVDDFDRVEESLSLQRVIEDMAAYDDVLFARFIDINGRIIYHSDVTLIGQEASEDHVFRALEAGEDLTVEHHHHLEDVDSYCIVRPVYVDEDLVGVMNIGFDPSYVAPVANQLRNLMFGLGGISLMFIFISMTLLGRTSKQLYDRTMIHPITGIPNRTALELSYRDDQVLGVLAKTPRTYVMLKFINLTQIQSTHGNEYLELILKQIKERLSMCLYLKDYYHLNHDTMMFVMDSTQSDDIEACIHLNLENLEKPIELEPFIFRLMPRFSIYKIKGEIPPLSELIRYLEATLAQMTQQGHQKVMMYETLVSQSLERKLYIEQLIQRLLQGDETKLNVLFQPVYDLKKERLFGFEALSRLVGESGEYISPVEFIPMIESQELIIEFGKHVITCVCRFIQALDSTDLKVSINVSTQELVSKAYVPHLIKTLANDTIHSSLVVEVTETDFARNKAAMNASLSALKEAGIEVALDDFGTGYSAIGYLSLAHFSFLKIDRTFIAELDQDIAQPVARTIIQLARQYGVKVVAEGVENAKQRDRLKTLGCDFVQGYYYHKPLKSSDALALTKKSS